MGCARYAIAALLLGCGTARTPAQEAEQLARVDPSWSRRLAPAPGTWRREAGHWASAPGTMTARLAETSIELSVGPHRVQLAPEGAKSDALDELSGRLVHRGAWPSTDAVWVASEARVELFLLLRGPDAPSEFSWRVGFSGRTPQVRAQHDGGLVFLDGQGIARLRVAPPEALDANGTRRAAQLDYDAGRLSVRLDLRGLAFPVLLDPSFETAVWTAGPPGPPERVASAMTYDAQRQRVLLFGGTQPDGFAACMDLSPNFNDTWEYSDAGWTPLTPATAPSPRYGHAMVYEGQGRTVLFGGSTGSGETWEWNGATWAQVADAGPSPRCDHAMAWDSARNRVVLFGGNPGCSAFQPSGDTWEWDGQAWRQVADAGPPARMQHALTFDSRRARTVLFGGYSSTAAPLGDTWEWDGTAWRLVAAADAGPPARAGHRLVFDSATNHALLFGATMGCNRSSCQCTCTYFTDTWAWDGTQWAQIGTGGAPGKALPAMAWDAARRRAVLFGGGTDDCCCGYAYGDTWELMTHGNSCASDAECDTGHCVDGACCDVSACGTCQACALRTGACVAVTGQQDPDSCSGTRTCDGAGACVEITGLANGATCLAPTMCASGSCADGVCCDRACDGQCEACVGDGGSCVAVRGAPVAGRSPCAGDGGPCALTCDGVTGARCTDPGPATCLLACVGSVVLRAVCDGAGGCGLPAVEACSPAVCGSCDGGCVGAACDAGCVGAECDAGCVGCAADAGACEGPDCAPRRLSVGCGCSTDGAPVLLLLALALRSRRRR